MVVSAFEEDVAAAEHHLRIPDRPPRDVHAGEIVREVPVADVDDDGLRDDEVGAAHDLDHDRKGELEVGGVVDDGPRDGVGGQGGFDGVEGFEEGYDLTGPHDLGEYRIHGR